MSNSYVHPYIPNSKPSIKKAMMKELGIRNIDELYQDVPKKYLLRHRLDLPRPSSEYDVKRHIESKLSKNISMRRMPIFMGAGCWPHYKPAVVENILQRSELLTSYTPYQSEISQGLLQILFEYQSMICELTGMDVANSSLYDWASSLGEAARMAMRIKNRNEIVIPRIIHPERLATLEAYVHPTKMQIKRVNYSKKNGQLDLKDLKSKVSDKTAAVYIENPSYLGFIETHVDQIGKITHDHEALFVVGVEPISLGVLRPPGDYGADIVIGEGQPLGNSMSFGGSLHGIFACRGDMPLIRQMPGRIIGMTETRDGTDRGFCMALQTREQHIRRERATSNICSNQSLNAIASTVYLTLLGPNGLKELSEIISVKTNYTIEQLSKIDGLIVPCFDSFHFQEFTVNFGENDVSGINRELLRRHNIHGGRDISKEFPELGQTALFCVTEIHSKGEIDGLVSALEKVVGK